MSKRQADHYRPVLKRKDLKIVRLRARLQALKRQWNQPAPFYNVRRDEMNPPVSGWKAALWAKQQGRCLYCCGPLWPRYHYDHKIPYSKGGPSHPSNYALACEPCNLLKHDTDSLTFAIKLLS